MRYKVPSFSAWLVALKVLCYEKLECLTPPSSSGLGYLILSQVTGVRLPLGVVIVSTCHCQT